MSFYGKLPSINYNANEAYLKKKKILLTYICLSTLIIYKFNMLSKIFRRSSYVPKYEFSFKSKLDAHFRLCRIDKPIGTLLLYQPCIWGTILG